MTTMDEPSNKDLDAYPVVFAPGAFDGQDGKVVPLTWGPGGPVIGEATVKATAAGLTTEIRFSAEPRPEEIRAAIAKYHGLQYANRSDPHYVRPPRVEPPAPDPHPLHVALLDAARGNETFTELVELHQPHPDYVRPDGTVSGWLCHGEQPGGYEWGWPDWPCETVGILARHLGVEVAE